MRPILWLSFFALCILSATRGAITTLLPSPLPGPLQQTLHFGVLTFLFALPTTTQLRATASRKLIVSLILFFPLPVIAASLAEGHVGTSLQVVVFALLPAVIVLGIANRTAAFGPESGSLRLLIPCIAGATGSLLLLPIGLPSSKESIAIFVMYLILTIAAAVAAIHLHHLLAGLKIIPAAAIVCGASTILLAAFTLAGVAQYPLGLTPTALIPDAILCFVFDAPILLLTLYLLREMQPIPFAARYLLIPLVAILEAIVVIHPHVTLTLAGGLALMVIGAVWLLRSTAPEAA